MKIIAVSNFDSETVNDKLIAANVSLIYAKDIVDFLNKKYSGNDVYFFKLVKDDHILYEFKP
jgi:hypothetical protein